MDKEFNEWVAGLADKKEGSMNMAERIVLVTLTKTLAESGAGLIKTALAGEEVMGHEKTMDFIMLPTLASMIMTVTNDFDECYEMINKMKRIVQEKEKEFNKRKI